MTKRALPIGPARFVFCLHDVTEERTFTEKILAKEQVAELGILVGSVAHEINNPIGKGDGRNHQWGVFGQG